MKNRWTGICAAALAVILLSGCGAGGERIADQTETKSAVQQETESLKEAENQENVFAQEAGETKARFHVGTTEEDFLLPDAREHVYTPEELSGLTAVELRLARNEIYARHGRRFKLDDLSQYFSGKSWYHGSVDADHFDDASFNQNERDNLDAIRQLEIRINTCSVPKIGIDEFPDIDGSTATLPISQALYRMATGASARDAERAVVHHKTTEAWMSLIRGEDSWHSKPDLVIAYEPGEWVREAMAKPGGNLLMKPIGRDALVFLSNKSNPVKSLTSRQIVDIYSGHLNSWKDVGGRDQQIMAFQRPEESGSQNLMEKLVMKGKPMAKAPEDLVAGEMGELIERVSAYDDTGEALGYSVYYYARNMYRKPRLTFMAVDGVTPDSDTIRAGGYPFVNEFYAAIRADEPKNSKAYELFEWLTSEDGQSLINGLGYVGVDGSKKELPEALTAPEESFNASIPLPKGDVILASGPYLYGEYGVGVFDSRMRLLQFINHVELASQDSSFLECGRDEVLFMRDTRTGEYGHYSLEKGDWVDREEDWDSISSPYDLAHSFTEDHPELLEKYGVTAEDVECITYGELFPGVMRISEGGMDHYYDTEGNHMMDFDKGSSELSWSVTRLNRQMAYLQADVYETGTSRYLIYRDGILIKELVSSREMGVIGEISPHFYTRINGNYLYVYNYEDEPCAKFLLGYYNND